MQKERFFSFLIIAFVYAVATAVGVLTYVSLPLDMWLSLLIADIAATATTFVFSLIFKNASVYDPYWSVQPIVILVCFALFTPLNIIDILVLTVVCLWGVRLTANWAYTFHGLKHQDWRYTMLHQKTGRWYPLINFFGIHLFPTLVVFACILPAVYLITSSIEGNVFSFIFVGVSLLAVILQGTADCQMHYFQRHRTKENFIRFGLWRHSRHPNYLGEILMWWGVGLASVLTIQSDFLLLAGAVINTLMFLIVSIPMADRRQAQKEGFDEYASQTRALLPIKKFKTNKNNN